MESSKYPGTLWHTSYNGVTGFIQKTIKLRSGKSKDSMDDYITEILCETCLGSRLKKESLNFKIDKFSISDINRMDINQLQQWIESIFKYLTTDQKIIADPIVNEIKKRVDLICDLGLGYLTLDRSLKTLSGGEAQRIRLATQIGTRLVGVMYILDEPSIGLHQRDNHKLIRSLRELRDLGNTVIVVEHDRDMMEKADIVIDVGPGPGQKGGKIVAKGTPNMLLSQKSLTSKFLSRELDIEIPKTRRCYLRYNG